MSSETSLNKKLRGVAVFDFDGTIIDGQSGFLCARYLFDHHMMPIKCLLELAWWGIRYKLRLPFRQNEARELVFSSLLGRDADEIDSILTQFHNQILVPRYRPQALQEIDRCKKEGLVTLLVSATFDPIARAAAQKLGIDGFVATKMQRDSHGNYTGKVEGSVIAGKEKYQSVVRWCNDHLGKGTWELKYAYGDHHSDLDLLSHAQVPFAVCPGNTLRINAHKRDWSILNWDA